MVDAGVGGGGRGYGFASCCGAGGGDAGGRDFGLCSTSSSCGSGSVVCADGGGVVEKADGGGSGALAPTSVGAAGVGSVGFG